MSTGVLMKTTHASIPWNLTFFLPIWFFGTNWPTDPFIRFFNRLSFTRITKLIRINKINISQLTEQGIGETVPYTTAFPDKPSSLCASGEAERSTQHTHQQITEGYINQEQIDGGTQQFVAAKQHKYQQVVQKSETSYESQTHGDYQVSGRAESAIWSSL